MSIFNKSIFTGKAYDELQDDFQPEEIPDDVKQDLENHVQSYDTYRERFQMYCLIMDEIGDVIYKDPIIKNIHDALYIGANDDNTKYPFYRVILLEQEVMSIFRANKNVFMKSDLFKELMNVIKSSEDVAECKSNLD